MAEMTMTISEQILLEKCREIEMLCKELYNYFAELYSDDESAALLWSKTAKEEENHAAQFTMVIRLKKSLPCMVIIDASKVESVLSQMRSIIAKVKATPPTLLDALAFSIKIEKHLAEFHLNCVVVFEDDSYRKLFNAMMASDKEHIASLQAAYDVLSASQARKT